MKRVLTLGVVGLVVSLVGLRGVPAQAQDIQNTSNDNPQMVNNDCSVSYSGGNYSDTTHDPDDSTIFGGGTISYQGGTSSQPAVNPSVDITYSPTYTVSNQDAPIVSISNSSDSSYSLSVSTTSNSSCSITVDTENSGTQTPYANLSVNDTGIVHVAYDGSATLRWDSYGMADCALDPINQSGTSGEYTLENITSNVTVTLTCQVSSDFSDFYIYPSTAIIKVLPPTFDYLASYISALQLNANKKVNLKSTSNFIEQAQKALGERRADRAQAFLQKSVDSVQQQASKGLAAADIAKYADAAGYLSKTLPVAVVVASDGCSVTATGTPGLILQYGANEQMRRGYGDEAVIPEGGTITRPIYAPNGWTATGEVVDATGLIYARDTQEVTTDDCPEPPVVYDPTLYNGYPEKWAVPEPGTVIDDWGYYNKTAESYVAFRVTDSGRTFPAGYGSASEWLDAATADGYVVTSPQTGDIAINTLDESFGGPIAWYVDNIDESGNYQMSAIRSDGNMNWTGGTIYESDYLRYIRIP